MALCAGAYEWSKPLGLYGQAPKSSGPIVVPEELRESRRPHVEKLQVAERFASGLSGFWDPTRREEYYSPPELGTFETAARERNVAKQAGFYVDRASDMVTSPLDIPDGDIGMIIQLAAQTIEMHSIEDHTRQQDAPEGAPIDSAQDRHWTILAYAHPDDYLEFIERVSEADEERG